MYPSGSYLDFEHAPAGAATWLQLLSGKLALALVPPTPRNLSTYLSWAAKAARWGHLGCCCCCCWPAARSFATRSAGPWPAC
jgi:hypothetical protein